MKGLSFNFQTHTLDAGQYTFRQLLEECLGKTKDHLLKECDRIAVVRELQFKRQLEKARLENKRLHTKLASLGHDANEVDAIPESAITKFKVPTYSRVPAVAVDDELLQPSSAAATGLSLETTSTVAAPDELSRMEVPPRNSGELEDLHSKPKTIVSLDDGLPTDLVRDESRHEPRWELWTEWKQPNGQSDLLHESSSDTLAMEMEARWLREHDSSGRSSIQQESDHPRSPFIVSPSSMLSVQWELASVPLLIFDLVQIPMHAFYYEPGLGAELAGYFIIAYWTFDILLRFLVFGYADSKGDFVFKRSLIARHYLKTGFTFDCIMVLPDWVSALAGAPRNVAALRILRLLRVMRIMRMAKVKRVIRVIHDTIDSEYISVLISIVINLMSILGCCHYLACFWFYVGSEVHISGFQSWTTFYEVDDTNWKFQYAISLQWAITQFTPGSSKIQPMNIAECTVAIVVLIFGMVFFSLFVSALTQHRMRLQQLTSKFDRDHWVLRRYLKQHGVSSELCMRTIKYVDACVAPQMQRVQRKEVLLMDYLSVPLQHEVQAEMYYHTLLQHPFFDRLKKHSLTLTMQLVHKAVKEMALAYTDLLFELGQVSHEMIFVSRGTLAYLHFEDQEASTDSNLQTNLSTPGGTILKVDLVRRDAWCCEPVIWVPWVHKGTSRAEEECALICIDTARMRTAVLEHKDRTFVRHCAAGYLKDLINFERLGMSINDVTRLSDLDNGEFLKAIREADEQVSGLHVLARVTPKRRSK